MKKALSRLECIACHKTYETARIQFRCDCGDLLTVTHDLPQILSRFGDLKALFTQRLADFSLPYRSGVWRYRELIHPLATDEIVTKPEGNTNLYRSATVAG